MNRIEKFLYNITTSFFNPFDFISRIYASAREHFTKENRKFPSPFRLPLSQHHNQEKQIEMAKRRARHIFKGVCGGGNRHHRAEMVNRAFAGNKFPEAKFYF